MTKIAVIGAGSWGSALALVLADNGHEVRLHARREDQVDEMNQCHTNESYLPGVVFPASIRAYTKMKEVLQGVSVVLIAVPTKAMRETMRALLPSLAEDAMVIHASKGIEPVTHKRVSEIIAEEDKQMKKIAHIAVLSGPSHAEEVALRQPTTVTVASENIEAAQFAQNLFMNKQFRVYTNPDLIGVEMGGALKNIIALVCGITNGLGLGDNTKAAIMTRGLAEMSRLGVHMGANPLTFSGLSGLGDLIVTCTSVHSRNWRAGRMIGEGLSMDEVLAQMGMVVEGVRTTKAAYELAQEKGVEMPLTEALNSVLFEGVTPQEATEQLMARMRTHEVETLFE
ncbi:NAD(P)H-dependent glycerol-3-phosphate dehydrogenase [Shouchella lonarensis]|uniref:Glycerol-3-phosphate dehydrogenase [NAD(P)+] n=1 Tax=Shouchella lonarensis TaxID=1464122 RepID=A0A1G6J0U7_9BACI|nr:NAD(P)H-dependent glycerol-3-phosphate dehydrogenase [Shouchella lonarensis]SDC12452.1 glycerol 3-phosphate dehydrogenase (NAD(P)+) [Shouchella lonarensis]